MPESGDMQDLFKKAAAIAAVVPEAMQEAAFNRALDMLTGEETQGERRTVPRRAAKKNSSRAGGSGDADAPVVDRLAKVTAISRDAASEVDQETSALGRSIALLVVADREANVDGLTAPEIASVLTEKFRLKTTRQAVQSALDNSGKMIDRQKAGGGAAVYRVMRAGEEWLATPADQRAGASSGRSRSRARKSAAPPPTKKASTTKRTTTTKKSASPGTGRVGPKGVLEALISDGYFSEPRGMAEIRQHLRDHKAQSFSNNDLSPTLIRLLREGKLKRTKPGKQYVYTAC